MAKILRLHNTGANNISDWDNTAQYNSAIINEIQDPSGATASKEITSIPSPFARMDLVKKAFDFVNNNELDGSTIHHKMVSHALDVAQIFFNFRKYEEQKILQIVKWDVSEISNLKQSEDYKHHLLGQTLDLFKSSDTGQFNFDLMNGLYMLRYIGAGAPNPLTIIGSTSPASLFYTSANNFDFLKGKIVFGGHQVLDSATSSFLSLKNRSDHEFIVWMYALRKAVTDFANRFPEVDKYLNLNYGHLNHTLQQRINALTPNSLSADYKPLEVSPGVPVEILGTQIGMGAPVNWGEKSDFAINSTKGFSGQLPLVLPCDTFSQQWIYTTALWNQSTQVPLEPESDINKRPLPADGNIYPYLTMKDFLEDTLIMTESKPNSLDFFDGNLVNHSDSDVSFLLPIKRKYFEYFTTQDLRNNISIECSDGPTGGYVVKVSLKIPVKKGNITFERIYISDCDVINPKNGSIRTQDFTILLFPRTKFLIGATPNYTIGVMSKDAAWKPRVDCMTGEPRVLKPELGPLDRNEDAAGNRIVQTSPMMPMYFFKENFDVIEISSGNVRGVVFPNWAGQAGGSIFEFSVDFGTSNTHIEYKTAGQNQSSPLDINESYCQLSTLNEDALSDPTYSRSIKENCIPRTIGAQDDIHFPLRTILSYKKATNWNTPTAPYITGGMSYYYGIVPSTAYNTTKSDLKWSTDNNVPAMLKCYLGSLMQLMRNKVVMEGGDLSQTKIRWFYPTSMPISTVTVLSNTWTQLYTEYFGPNAANNVKEVPESIAPYRYYQNNFGAGVDVMTVDIGGGTSDAYIVDSNGQPACITSFRFAANSLLGDGFVAAGLDNNGFVSKYRTKFNNILDDNGLNNLVSILEDVAATGVSADYISLLFGLKDNTDVIRTNCQDKVNFIQMLQQSPGAKTLVLLFYTAIVYHLATFIKAKKAKGLNIQEPAVLAFSGNGSKLLQILGVDTSVGKGMLEDFTKAIFEKVNGCQYAHHNFRIVLDPDKPKEATCKGGLLITDHQVPNPQTVKNMKDTLLGTSSDRFITGNDTYDNLCDEDWRGLENVVTDFKNVFFELAKEKDIENTFGAVSLTKLEENEGYFASDIKTRTSDALNFMELLNTKKPIEDALFFYPVTAMLNILANKLL